VTAVHVVVPDGIDDPARPSGGNAYDRHACRGLAALGWTVHEHAVPGTWPQPDAAAYDALAGVMAQIPDDALVLIDGLIASTAPDVLEPQAHRLRLVVLVHLPLADHREAAVLTAAAAVVGTSAWTRRTLLELYALPDDRVHVAEPGVDAADLAPGTATAGSLLCVAAVIARKGHDVLLEALATLTDLAWHCVCVGSLDRDAPFVAGLRRRLDDGLEDRVSFPGPRTGPDLARSYAAADLTVLASREEPYGMVVTEALARGLPVVATDVGGVPEALGRDANGTRPGLLVPPDDAAALGAALRAWLSDTDLRRRLRSAARERRAARAGWPVTRAGGCPAGGGAVISSGWLALRESADAAARSPELVDHVRRRLPATGGRLIHDLGGGTGAMGRWLAPLLPGPQHWIVHDRDADLLGVAAAHVPGPAVDGARVTVEALESDVTRLRPDEVAGASLITASALLDLLTAAEVDRLVAVCAAARCPVLFTLSVVGRVELAPPHPLDARVAEAFNDHQRREVGGARLLGPDAIGVAATAFARYGTDTLVQPSPWRLGASDADLTAAWFTGWIGAACEQQAGLASATEAYAAERLAQARAGALTVTVDHADLLALH
jgi:glycosyltransferase involved in cell wall biosynthesis